MSDGYQRGPFITLLIEDNPDHAELIMRSFEEHDVVNTVYRIADGAETLDFLFRRGEYTDPKKSPRPNLILLDLRMPRIDGLEVLREIKTSDVTRHIPVVILTSSEAEVDVIRAYERYANSYIVKPGDYNELCRLVKELGSYWLTWNYSFRERERGG
ncbi:MAG: response regulator [Deltaproteobacteria bacterium]|nr:response regulator [Deltaproteobacteria bacterium]